MRRDGPRRSDAGGTSPPAPAPRPRRNGTRPPASYPVDELRQAREPRRLVAALDGPLANRTIPPHASVGTPDPGVPMASTLTEFNDGNFESEVLKSNIPVLVDFTATWCGPCQQLKPIVEELAKDFACRVKMGKLDIDGSKQVPVNYGIMAVPTIILFKGGQEVQKITGLKPKAELRKRLEALPV